MIFGQLNGYICALPILLQFCDKPEFVLRTNSGLAISLIAKSIMISNTAQNSEFCKDLFPLAFPDNFWYNKEKANTEKPHGLSPARKLCKKDIFGMMLRINRSLQE